MCYSSPKSAFPCPSSLPCLPFSHEALPVNHQLLRPTTFMSSCKLTLISNEFNSKFWNLYIQHITISTIQLTKSSTWITAKPVLRYSHSLLSPILPVLMLCYAKSLQSCLTLCDPKDGSLPGSPHPWDSPGKNTGVGCHFLLQYSNLPDQSKCKSYIEKNYIIQNLKLYLEL